MNISPIARSAANAVKGISGVQGAYASKGSLGIETDSTQDEVFIENFIEDNIDGHRVFTYANGEHTSMYTTGTPRDYLIVFNDLPGVVSAEATEPKSNSSGEDQGPSFQIDAAGPENAAFLDALLKDTVSIQSVDWPVNIRAMEPITSDMANYVEAVKLAGQPR